MPSCDGTSIVLVFFFVCFFNDTASTEISTYWTHSFPTRRSSDLIDAGLEVAGNVAAAVIRAVPAAGCRAGALHRGIERAAGLAITRPRLAEAGFGRGHVKIGRPGLGDQRVEVRVPQPLPPAGQIGSAHV